MKLILCYITSLKLLTGSQWSNWAERGTFREHAFAYWAIKSAGGHSRTQMNLFCRILDSVDDGRERTRCSYWSRVWDSLWTTAGEPVLLPAVQWSSEASCYIEIRFIQTFLYFRTQRFTQWFMIWYESRGLAAHLVQIKDPASVSVLGFGSFKCGWMYRTFLKLRKAEPEPAAHSSYLDTIMVHSKCLRVCCPLFYST